MGRSFPARPFVSFVLATFNRGPVLMACLERTLACALATLGEGRFSITVVDNASTDGTAQRLHAFADHQRHVKLIYLPKNGGPVAKNAALHNNSADIVVLLDDDAYPLPGALAQMVRHFQDDPHLAAAVFDVTLPDGHKEASAYPDVCIGAGTALRGAALRSLANAKRPGLGMLPADFFMQAEEYDLSFRLLAAGWSVQRFWDMPLMHLKSPGARVGQRTTRLDVRNNLWLLARYVPEPMCHQLAADWLARYWQMAVGRDAHMAETTASATDEKAKTHKGAYVRGAGEGLLYWRKQRSGGDLLLNDEVIERIFKFDTIRERLRRAKEQMGLKRVAFGDWGKNILAFHRAAEDLDLEVVAVVDGNLSGDAVEYRGIPVVEEETFRSCMEQDVEAVVITALSRVHAQRRAESLRRVLSVPVVDLFAPSKVFGREVAMVQQS